ncbi:UPF0147 family protein [Candidatus Woesearchaeota archaeon]|nr:UPF0147 family protein [Candidatus Woesearchaeota archaeon]
MAAQKDDRIAGIIEALRELTQDSTVPRNIKMKVESVIQSLAEDTDVSIRVNKALSELDEISDDTNLQAYTRTQIWNITSMLEMIHV